MWRHRDYISRCTHSPDSGKTRASPPGHWRCHQGKHNNNSITQNFYTKFLSTFKTTCQRNLSQIPMLCSIWLRCKKLTRRKWSDWKRSVNVLFKKKTWFNGIKLRSTQAWSVKRRRTRLSSGGCEQKIVSWDRGLIS